MTAKNNETKSYKYVSYSYQHPRTYGIGIIQGILIGFMFFFFSDMVSKKYGIGKYSRMIPEAKKVQIGYANPSNLEVKLKDVDGDGRDQTILQYNNLEYHLKFEDGRLKLVHYQQNAEYMQTNH